MIDSVLEGLVSIGLGVVFIFCILLVYVFLQIFKDGDDK